METNIDEMIFFAMKKEWYNEYHIPMILMPIHSTVFSEKIANTNGFAFEVLVDELINWTPIHPGKHKREYEIATAKLSYARGIDKIIENNLEAAHYYLLISDKYLPNDFVILRHLGLLLAKQGNIDEALKYYQILLELSKSHEVPAIYMAEAAYLASEAKDYSMVKRILPYLEQRKFSWLSPGTQLFRSLSLRLE